jgi:hypothetical protein
MVIGHNGCRSPNLGLPTLHHRCSWAASISVPSFLSSYVLILVPGVGADQAQNRDDASSHRIALLRLELADILMMSQQRPGEECFWVYILWLHLSLKGT